MKKQIDKIVLINFKKHKDYKGEINGNHFIISGVNGAGKSSVFDAVKRLIGQRQDQTQEPMHVGEDKASIAVYLSSNGDKYMVEEKFTKKTSSLKFYRVNGEFKDELRPALERLAVVVGNPIDFTPLIDMSGKEQMQFFKDNMGVDLSMYEHEYENKYDDRTLVNREVKALQAKLESPELRVFDADKIQYTEYRDARELQLEKVDTQMYYRERGEIEKHNGLVLQGEQKVATIKEQIAKLTESLAAGEKWLEEHPQKSTEVMDERIKIGEGINTGIDEQIVNVSEWNRNVDKVKNHIAAEEALNYKKGVSIEFTQQLERMQEKLFKAIKSTNISSIVPGLDIVYETEEVNNKIVLKTGLTLDGLPFHRKQQSYGNMLKALIKLAAHFNAGKLNFIAIGEWNLLDEENQKEIIALANDNPDLGIQLGIEKVDMSREIITQIIE